MRRQEMATIIRKSKKKGIIRGHGRRLTDREKVSLACMINENACN
jgi:hypothetical protein